MNEDGFARRACPTSGWRGSTGAGNAWRPVKGTFIVYLLSTVDLFIVWQVTLLAMGLAVLTKRGATPVVVGLSVFYAAIAVAIAAVRTQFGN